MSAKISKPKKQQPQRRKVSSRAHFRSVILLEEKHLSSYAARDSDAIRRAPLSFECLRPNYWRDADRILHSFAFNRFLDKTQVFYLNENVRLTHRMLHVQLVAKISRLLARALRLNAHLVEAIALGHDIGHTPFGHEGERILSAILHERLGRYFKHSVQSVRWLNILEKNSQTEGVPLRRNGLNLSLQVLDGILCHDGEDMRRMMAPDRSKDIEKFKRQYYQKMNKKQVFHEPMTLEGCLVRFCDVIAYIGRDIEDAIAVGLIDRFPDTPLGSSNGQIIDSLVMDLLRHSEGKNRIAYGRNTFKALSDLYAFNQQQIYRNRLIAIHHFKIERLFHMIFNEILKDIDNGDETSPVFKDHILPIHLVYPAYLAKSGPIQVVVDFIAGMTDRYFINLVGEMFLPSPFPVNFADLSRITGMPEKYLDLVIQARTSTTPEDSA